MIYFGCTSKGRNTKLPSPLLESVVSCSGEQLVLYSHRWRKHHAISTQIIQWQKKTANAFHMQKVWSLKITILEAHWLALISSCKSDVTFPHLGRACCHGDGAVPLRQSSKCSKIIPSSRLAGESCLRSRSSSEGCWYLNTCHLSASASLQTCRSTKVWCFHASHLWCIKIPWKCFRRGWMETFLSCFAVGALWTSCAAGLCCTEGRVTLTNQTRGFCWVCYYWSSSAPSWQILCGQIFDPQPDRVHMQHHIQRRTCRGRVGSQKP